MGKRAEIPPGALYMLVLKTLARLGPLHGGAIAEHIHASDNNRRARFYRLAPGGRKKLHAEIAAFEKVTRAITCVIQPA